MHDDQNRPGPLKRFLTASPDSVGKTVIVATTVCLFASMVVAAAAVSLRPMQAANKLQDKQINILEVAGLYQPGVDITEALMTHAVDEARKEVGKFEAREKRREEAQKKREAPAEVKELKSFEQLELAKQEAELLRVMVNHFDKTFPEEEGPAEDEEGTPIEYEHIFLMDYLMDELEDLTFENQTYEKLKNELFQEFDEKETINLHQYLNHPDVSITRLISTLLTSPDTSPFWKKVRADISFDGNIKKVVQGAVYLYKSRKVEQIIQQCKNQL